MKRLQPVTLLLAAMLLAGGTNIASANDETAAMKELVPTGKLRAGIVYAPALSAFFAVKDADGRPRGVTVDLVNELAQQLGVAPEFMVVPNSGLATDAVESGAIDVSFMPVDDERRKRVDFGPNYCLIESTYMVTRASGIKTLAEVDRPNVRVVGIANTTTIRAAGRTLKNTGITAATSVEEAVAMLRTGKADAFALSRDSLPPFVALLPGSRIVDGGFSKPALPSPYRRTGRTRWPMSAHFWSRPRRQAASAARSTGRDSVTNRWRRLPVDNETRQNSSRSSRRRPAASVMDSRSRSTRASGRASRQDPIALRRARDHAAA